MPRTHFLVRVLIGLFGMLFVAVSWNIWVTRPWTPIEPFEIQTVLEVTDTHVIVEGTKCYTEPVKVFGSFWWQSIEPPGTILNRLEGSAMRPAGCRTFVFENPIPPEALASDVETWALMGQETPEGSRPGVTGVWETEEFSLGGDR